MNIHIIFLVYDNAQKFIRLEMLVLLNWLVLKLYPKGNYR